MRSINILLTYLLSTRRPLSCVRYGPATQKHREDESIISPIRGVGCSSKAVIGGSAPMDQWRR